MHKRDAAFDRDIRTLTMESPTSRPFLCQGSPFGCDIAEVGINPGTDTPFWHFWDDRGQFDKLRWLEEYRRRKGGQRTPTRDRIELFNAAVRPFRVIELNLFHEYSPREAALPKEHRTTELFDFLLAALKPRLLFVHGSKPRQHLERKFGVTLPNDTFTQIRDGDVSFTIFTASKHLAFVKGGDDYVREAARRIKEYLGEADRTDQPIGVQPILTKKVATFISSRTVSESTLYSLEVLRSQYPEGRRTPLSESAVADVVAHGKHCSRCQQLLPANAFAPSPQSSTGLRAACRKCLAKR